MEIKSGIAIHIFNLVVKIEVMQILRHSNPIHFEHYQVHLIKEKLSVLHYFRFLKDKIVLILTFLTDLLCVYANQSNMTNC